MKFYKEIKRIIKQIVFLPLTKPLLLHHLEIVSYFDFFIETIGDVRGISKFWSLFLLKLRVFNQFWNPLDIVEI